MAQDAGVVSNKKITSPDSHLIPLFDTEQRMLFRLRFKKQTNRQTGFDARYDTARVREPSNVGLPRIFRPACPGSSPHCATIVF
jgi:hypothetical protein